MSTTQGVMKTRFREDATDDVYLAGAGCVVCAQVRMGLGSGSKVWFPGSWIRCVLHNEGITKLACLQLMALRICVEVQQNYDVYLVGTELCRVCSRA
jgi:hypothetical protein